MRFVAFHFWVMRPIWRVMTRLRLHISALLIALLTLTGYGTAMAKGMPQSVGVMELCAGQATVLIAVDANGEPTAPQQHCPECTLLALDMIADQSDPLEVSQAQFAMPKTAEATSVAVQRLLKLKARAPPLAV
ncbi:hypothetical protein [Cognatishimia maritima]|uniref:DUF2946 domain-containing protein n=1 Tax=Cognatishimia maritima TaxID=870908 RepID=A0A1M5KL39_9RHOB|nr:hypothetical protein [Cognatishimia maritima]SHG53486.1 hypothetical protein SAMN04488044_1007 [Cognatishimia maritima]